MASRANHNKQGEVWVIVSKSSSFALDLWFGSKEKAERYMSERTYRYKPNMFQPVRLRRYEE